MIAAIAYFLAIIVAEGITVAIHPLWGLTCHIVMLVAIITHSSLTGDNRIRHLVLSLALVPLVRIMSLSMPLANVPQIWWYPIIYIPLLAAAITAMRIMGYRAGDIGFKPGLFHIQLIVALTGFVFGVVEYLILVPEAAVAVEYTWREIWVRALIFLVCTGFVEEFIFRGVLQRAAVEAFGEWRGIIYISAIFAVVHMIHYTEVGLLRVLIDIAFVFVVAMFFGGMVKKTGSLLGVTLAHGLTNTLIYLVVPTISG